MRTEILLDNKDASVNQTSNSFKIDCGQDMRWEVVVTKSGTDGNPHLIIEESIDNSIWIPLMDYDSTGINNFFLVDDTPYAVRDSYFMGSHIRVRIEPNDNTTGTITAKLGIKTKSV